MILFKTKNVSVIQTCILSLLLFVSIHLLVIANLFSTEHSFKPPVSDFHVNIIKCDWHDPARNRDIPVKIYYPNSEKGIFPVIIFSHGLGSNRDGYEYLGRYWAGSGYISVHLQHHGSDSETLMSAGLLDVVSTLKESVSEENAIHRVSDVSFAIDELMRINAQSESPLFEKINSQAIGMAGHSYGGWTAMAVAGQRSGPKEIILTESRIKAAVAMSAPVPASSKERDRSFMDIKIPVFIMTGTLDNCPLGETSARERRIVYDKTTNSKTCFVTFNGANHFSFGGRALGKNDKFKSMICEGSLAFFETYLRGNMEARGWLYNGGYARSIGSKGVFEKKESSVQ